MKELKVILKEKIDNLKKLISQTKEINLKRFQISTLASYETMLEYIEEDLK